MRLTKALGVYTVSPAVVVSGEKRNAKSAGEQPPRLFNLLFFIDLKFTSVAVALLASVIRTRESQPHKTHFPEGAAWIQRPNAYINTIPLLTFVFVSRRVYLLSPTWELHVPNEGPNVCLLLPRSE